MASVTKKRKVADALLYILPTKLQKSRLQCMIKSAEKNGFCVATHFSAHVTHVITELESRQDVIKKLLPDDSVWCDDIQIVSTAWFAASMRAKKPASTEGYQLQENKQDKSGLECQEGATKLMVYECTQATPLHHHNAKFTEPLELLERYYQYRGEDQDYPRALAYRRCACVLKYMPHPLTSISHVDGNKNVGKHCRQILQDLLDYSESQEVEDIRRSDWFRKMEMFTSVFGVGPSIGKKWISQGVTSIDDAIQQSDIERKEDQRIAVGLAFHEDLNLPVTLEEATAIKSYIQTEADRLLPGVTVVITGGFRRGKQAGHDVDLLISHPDEGCEVGLLSRLLAHLCADNLVLFGAYQPNTFKMDMMEQEVKSNLKNTLDNFEKWIGVIKIHKDVRDEGIGGNESNHGCGAASGKHSHLQANVPTHSSTNDMPDSCVPSKCETLAEPNSEDNHNNSCPSIIPPSCQNRVKSQFVTSEPYNSPAQDISLATKQPKSLMELKALANCRRDWIARRVDLVIAPASQYYYALVGWTGSKQFNRSLRLWATRESNMTLTSHALYDKKQHRILPARSEKEVFDNLGVPYHHHHFRNC